MIIALAQTNIIWEDKLANLEKVRRIIESFADNVKGEMDDKLILFPEMSLTGFSMNTKATSENDRWTVSQISKLAAEYGVCVGIGWVKQTDELCENHYSIIAATGTEISDYTKIHPFSYSGEDQYFRGGDKLAICRLGDMNIGTTICYDLRFPEQYRAMAKDVDMIFVPANWPAKRSLHWKTLLQARAIENQCYVAGVNCCGDMDGQFYSGDSCLFDPSGNVVELFCENLLGKSMEVSADSEVEGLEKLLVYRIENNVAEIRNNFPALKDIKPF